MESKKNNEFYEQFHKEFAEWEPAPPASAWNKIEARLDEDDRKPAIWWWVGGIVLLLIAGAAYMLWPKINNQPARVIAANSKPAKQVDVVPEENKPVNTKTKKSANASGAVTALVNTNKPVPVNINHPTETNKVVEKHETKISAPVAASKPKNNNAVVFSEPKTNTKPSEKELIVATNSEAKHVDANSSVVSKTDHVQEGNVETETSMSVAKKPEQVTKKTDSITHINDVENTLPVVAKTENPIKADSLNTRKDSVVQTLKPKTDSVQKPVVANAVKDSAKPILSKPSIFSISAFAGPEQEGRAILSNTSAFNLGGEKTKLHVIYGLKASFALSKKIELSFAFSYSQMNVNYPATDLSFDRHISQPYTFNSSYGDMSVPAATMLQGFSQLAPPSITMFHMQYKYTQTVQFMNVPVCIKINLGTKKLKPYVTAGANIQYVVSAKAEVDLLKETETDAVTYSLNTRKINIAPSVSIGLEYSLTKHLGIYIEPNFRYNLLPSSTGSSVKSTSYFIGCLGGLRLNL